MKKFIRKTGIVATSAFLFFANPVIAQDATTTTTDTRTADDDNDTDYGWIGLLGLAGLLGLRKKDDRRTVTHSTGTTNTNR